MFLKKVTLIFVILACLTDIAIFAMPYSHKNRNKGIDVEQTSKDISRDRGRTSYRKTNVKPSRYPPLHGSLRSDAQGFGVGEKKRPGRRHSRRDVFADFYEAKSEKSVVYRHEDNIDDGEGNRCSQDNGGWSVDSDLMGSLTNILLTGKLGKNNDKKSVTKLVSGPSFKSNLASTTKHGTFLEIGTGVTAFYLASSEKKQGLVATVITPEPSPKKLTQLSKSSDAFIGSVSSRNIKAFVKSLMQDPEVFFGSILLSNLTALIGDNLPHEFENLLGHLFLLAKETYIVLPTANKYTSSYMHSWSSIGNLAERACYSLDVTCTVSALSTDLTKVTLVEGRRPLSLKYCCGEGKEDCSMTYMYESVNGTRKIAVGSSKRREVRIHSTGLLLSTLLKLNLVGSSLETVVVPLLEMDCNPEIIARNIFVTNQRLMIHSELPTCQSIIYETDIIQQARYIAEIVGREEKTVPEIRDENVPMKSNANAMKKNGVKSRMGVANVNTVLRSQQNRDQNLVMNMHTKYANKDNLDQSLHNEYANDGLNVEYGDGDGGKSRGGSQKHIFHGENEKQFLGGVAGSQSAIKDNQRAFRGGGGVILGNGGNMNFVDTNSNGVGLHGQDGIINVAKNSNGFDYQKDLSNADSKSNNIGLRNVLNHADAKNNKLGLQNRVNLDINKGDFGPKNGVNLDQKVNIAVPQNNMDADTKSISMGRPNNIDVNTKSNSMGLHRRKQSEVGWDGDDEATERQRNRPLEWERAREEMDGYRGAGQGMMKSQVDMVADLWQRENEDVSDSRKNPEVPGSNWDRETTGRSSPEQSASKLVAVGNLLLTRDEENPTALSSWERGDVQTRGARNEENEGRRVGGKNGPQDELDEMHLEEKSKLEILPIPVEAPLGMVARDDSRIRDSNVEGNQLPSQDSGKTSDVRKLPKPVRKQFRQTPNTLDGVGKEKEVERMVKKTEENLPKTLPENVAVREQGNRVMEGPRYQQRQLLQDYNDFAYNANAKMRSDTLNEPLAVQQEINARRMMMESVAKQLENGEVPKWEELEDPEGDYFDDGFRIGDGGEEKLEDGDVDYYRGDGDVGGHPDTIIHQDDHEEEDGWSDKVVDNGQLRTEGGDCGDILKENEMEEIDRRIKEKMKLKENEGEKMFDAMWQALEGVFQEEEEHVFSLMTYGGKALSLLGAKVSRSFPNASVLTIIPARDEPLMAAHRKLQESLQLTNNIVTQSELTNQNVLFMYQQMEYFRFQVLGLVTFEKLVTYGASFSSYLGHLLSLAQTTFIEVPHPANLALLQVLIHPNSKDESQHSFYKGILSASLEGAGVLNYSIMVLDEIYLQNNAKLVRVDVHAFHRQVSMDCSGSLAWFKQDASKPLSLAPLRSAAAGNFPIRTLGGAIRLQSLLTLGLNARERKLLFQDYLKLPVHSDMCPMTILWQAGRLVYSPIIDSTIENPDQHVPCADNSKTLVETMLKQLDTRPFSFMEYGAGNDGLAVTLATKYPNSTFILLSGSGDNAETLQEVLDSRNISNTVITGIGIDLTFTTNLASSPDFMRYQYIGVDQLFTMMTANKRHILRSMFGDILSTGVTTFFQMPSAQMLSLAVSTLFPETLCEYPEMEIDVFQASNHPLPAFKNYELRLMKENIATESGQVNLSASLVHPNLNQDGSQLGWSLVRMDVTHLEMMVDHHFMYVLDGHKHKYHLNCNSNATHYDVYLVRAHDGFKIPYEEVKGISLIALLRMGLLPDVKENFYDQFLKLPLYGDMAPWNILFSGGRLEYIDYDTKHITMDKLAPAAYQIMAMLLNYRRTVDDFGHCNFDGRNKYGFDLVSHCVGSTYNGPCTDERFPVACADQSCRANYIECLRVLNEIEQKHTGIKTVAGLESHSSGNARGDHRTASKQDDPSVVERMELSFKGHSNQGHLDYQHKR